VQENRNSYLGNVGFETTAKLHEKGAGDAITRQWSEGELDDDIQIEYQVVKKTAILTI